MDVDSNSDECFDLREADQLGSDLDLDLDSDSGLKVLEAVKPKAKVCIQCCIQLTCYSRLVCQRSQGKKCVKGAAHQELMTRMEKLHFAKRTAKGQKTKGDIGR